ncbi:MAG TPA: GNAT family N-acyltransferase [Stackebrandtia sp.]|jgi:putative hemolysin|uniref:GNAT family N-acetyltransferase n=1 Tax=Stackebrandtia sp. TaxID=2023065 RepID=UPI002D58EC4E|nr:GNAT family N-acyltransferase [Stackebrandtia sp.]HZE37180.1 GNAT family N-acyltransferase [Stackebrandtia sp.]
MSINASGVANATRRYTVRTTRHPDEIMGAQRLRYRVFASEGGACLPRALDGRDVDEFDAHCDHLILTENATGDTVGTYRLLPPGRARTLYSDTEFDLSALSGLRPELTEAGRACVHPDHRDGAAIGTLWSGIADYLRRTGNRYLIGCCSLSLEQGGAQAAAVWDRVRDRHLAPESLRVTPYLPWDCRDVPRAGKVRVPPLLRGYLRLGAVVCGPAAYDPDFGTADLLMLLDLDRLDPRYARYFGLDVRR